MRLLFPGYPLPAAEPVTIPGFALLYAKTSGDLPASQTDADHSPVLGPEDPVPRRSIPFTKQISSVEYTGFDDSGAVTPARVCSRCSVAILSHSVALRLSRTLSHLKSFDARDHPRRQALEIAL